MPILNILKICKGAYSGDNNGLEVHLPMEYVFDLITLILFLSADNPFKRSDS